MITHGAHTEKDEQQLNDTGNLTTFYHDLGLTGSPGINAPPGGVAERGEQVERRREKARPAAQGRLTRVRTV